MKTGEAEAHRRAEAVALLPVEVGVVNKVAAVGEVYAAGLSPHAGFIAQHMVAEVVFDIGRGAGDFRFAKRQLAPVHFGAHFKGRNGTALQPDNSAGVALVELAGGRRMGV